MTTFPDDTIRFACADGRYREFCCLDLNGCTWPPPETLTTDDTERWGIHPAIIGQGPWQLVAMSPMTDRERMSTTVFFRGATYAPVEVV